METHLTLEALPRTDTGTAACTRARRSGRIPAVIYGHKEASVPLSVEAEGLIDLIHRGARIIDIKTPGKTERAMIKEVQYDHLGEEVLHVDFARVSETEKIRVTVSVVLHGQPAGVREGGHLDQPVHEITVECLAQDIPDKIDVNVAELQIGGSITVGELPMPEGVVCLLDPNIKAVIVHEPREIKPAVEAVATEEEAAAEPEVIRQRKEEEPEEEPAKGRGKGKE